MMTVGACLAIGSFVFGAKSCTPDEGPRAPLPHTRTYEVAEKPPREIDMAPLETLRARTDAPREFDTAALDHVLGEVARADFRREPHLRLSTTEVVALDPKEATGKTIETVGTVRGLDREAYPSGVRGVNALWAFALEGEDGSRVVVVKESRYDGDGPVDSYGGPTGPKVPIEEGTRARVRGVYLQKRTGSIGKVDLDAPAPVLVGREYRRTYVPPPPMESFEKAQYESIVDRFNAETHDVESDAHWQLMRWLSTKGRESVTKDLREARITFTPWRTEQFLRWMKDLENDKDATRPADRDFTVAQRGKVFRLTGVLGDYVKEDWETVRPNLYDVGRRYQMILLSDHYRNVGLRLDSPVPISDWPGVYLHPDVKQRKLRVVAYGIFLQNYSYEPEASMRVTGTHSEITTPYFMLIHVEAEQPAIANPLYTNPFFWVWVSLLVFGVGFFLVMNRLEKREAGTLREQQLRIRRKNREAGVPGTTPVARPGAPPPPAEAPGSGGPSSA